MSGNVVKRAGREEKRAGLVRALSAIVLAEGLDALSLRPAAARLGTSDRMLLYYFGSKAELVAETLEEVSGQLAVRLAVISGDERLSPREMIRQAVALLTGPEVLPFMTLWEEICVRSARGDVFFRQVAERSVAFWSGWICERTVFPAGVEPEEGARAILVVLEGMIRVAPDSRGAVALAEVLETVLATGK